MHLFVRVVRRRVSHHCHLVAKLSSKANGRFDARVCDQPDDDEPMNTVRLELQIQVCVGKATGAPVLEGDDIPGLRLELAADLAAPRAVLEHPQPHIGKIYHLTGPQSENRHFYAEEYSKALGRTITFQDIPVEAWRDALRAHGFPVHVVNHLRVMGPLHRAGRFDRLSDEVLTLTGQPLSVQEFVRNHAAAFTTQAPMMASA
jgi:hypothetical protein